MAPLCSRRFTGQAHGKLRTAIDLTSPEDTAKKNTLSSMASGSLYSTQGSFYLTGSEWGHRTPGFIPSRFLFSGSYNEDMLNIPSLLLNPFFFSQEVIAK